MRRLIIFIFTTVVMTTAMAATPPEGGIPVAVEGDTLFYIHTARGGYSAERRAEMVGEALTSISKRNFSGENSLHLLDGGDFVDIIYGDQVITTVTGRDAEIAGTTPVALAKSYVPVLRRKIDNLREERNIFEFLKRGALFIAVITLLYLLFRLTNRLFRRLRRKVIRFRQQRLKPVVIRDYELLDTHRLGLIMLMGCNILRYLVLLVELICTVPILFAIFPQTENLALRIIRYIVEPVRMIVTSVIEYIPNLFIIVVIWTCVRYIVKGLHYISDEIRGEKLKITGFYPDWAEPTFNIIRFLLYAFMIAMIYPYLLGSKSGVFQGISVFVGLIISLGSSTVIGNVISGFVITYMRPFHIGDHIKLNDTIGNVIEKTPFVTRLRTRKNELVTIPNSFIMSSHTINYSASARRYGLIIHQTITVGYDVPWRKVHSLLIDAALKTRDVLEHPAPFVLETEFSDNYSCYQINAYIHNADEIDIITSDLLEHVQDEFGEAGIDLVAPTYFAERNVRR